MKKNRLILITLITSMAMAVNVQAQFEGVGELLSGSITDGEKILQAYLTPYSNAFGADLNGSWYTTAKPHSPLGFDITLSANVAIVPTSDLTFNINEIGLSSEATITGGPDAPTIAGGLDTRPTISYTDPGSGITYASFETPEGADWRYIPSPMVQVGVGLIKGTDVSVRFLPKVSYKDYASISMWGVGLKHSLKQHIPVLKRMPFFNLSVFAGYTSLNTTGHISFTPDYYADNLGADDQTTLAYDNQTIQVGARCFTGDLLASFDMPFITVYAGAGVSNTSVEIGLFGDYPLATISGTDLVVTDDNRLTDPFNIKADNTSGSVTKPRLTAGAKIKLAVITINASYTYANYSVLSAGLGVSFR